MYLDANGLSLSPMPPEAVGEVSYAAMEESITFSTTPFEAETEVTGAGSLRLWLSSTTTDADVFVRLGRINADGEDVMAVGPENNAVAFTQGWLRASHRKLDAERSPPYRPYHTHDELQPLRPDEAVALDVEIWSTSIVFPEGTRLILEIAGKAAV